MVRTPLLPAWNWLRHYSHSWFSGDLIAGTTTAAVILPQSMAYASLVELPVEHGLYTVLLTLPLYALLGASCALSVSTTSPIALLTATAVVSLVAPDDPEAYAQGATTYEEK